MTEKGSPTESSSQAIQGSFLLIAGLLLLILRGLQLMKALPAMPGFWYEHDAIWWGIGLVTTASGAWWLWQGASADGHDRWRPTRGGKRFEKLLLYTRVGCHLCEEARELLDQHARWLPEVIEVDIDHDPRLVERYGHCVPVVSLDGKVRFRGRISPILFRRLIEATPPNGH